MTAKARKALRQHSLGLFFGLIFLAALAGQAFSGWPAFNDEQVAENLGQVSLGAYLTSASFAGGRGRELAERVPAVPALHPGHRLAASEGVSGVQEPGRTRPGSDGDQKVGRYATNDSPAWARTGGLWTILLSWSLA